MISSTFFLSAFGPYEAFGKHHHCLGTFTLERFLASRWVGVLGASPSQEYNHPLGINDMFSGGS